jgi:hypothetical protein
MNIDYDDQSNPVLLDQGTKLRPSSLQLGPGNKAETLLYSTGTREQS